MSRDRNSTNELLARMRLSAMERGGELGAQRVQQVGPRPSKVPSAPESPPPLHLDITEDEEESELVRRRDSLLEEARKTIQSAEIADHIAKYSAKIDAEMREISLKLCEYAEIAFEEHKSHALLTSYLIKKGFTVKGHPGLPTAFVATFENGEGGRNIGINCEYDALRGLGQACGHNLIAITALGSALAMRSTLLQFSLPGKVTLLGTPAEEGGGGKVIMLREGAYVGMDCCLISHPGGESEGMPEGTCPWSDTKGGSLACTGFEAEFIGRSAHAGAEPWMGINALDAAVQGYSAVGMLRQQIKPDHRVHGIIIPPPEGWNQNAIPEYCKVKYGVRAPDVKQLDVLYRKVVKCFQAAAEASGCTINLIEDPDFHYADLRNNGPLAEAYADIMKVHFGQTTVTDISAAMTASTDFGNVCYEVPAISPNFGIPAEIGGGNHTKAFAAAAAKPKAHVAAMKVLQGMALVGMKFVVDDEFSSEVKTAFRRFKKSIEEP